MAMNIERQFDEIRQLIHEAREKAYYTINSELVQLYWNIGKYISEKIRSALWGDAVIDKLADFMKQNEPEIKGFNRRNLFRMRTFYETYTENEKVSTLWTQLSWSHHRHILSKTKTIDEKVFYMQLSIKQKYSVRELERIIDSAYYERYFLSTNLPEKKTSSKLKLLHPNAGSQLIDSYSLEFLNLPGEYFEKDLQSAIVKNLKLFVLEAGKDFTFVGENYRLQIGNKDFYLDLLFFHRELQSLVVFELKITEFKPEYIGKMDFYLEALDRQIKKPHENPSVGILLCKDKDDEIVELALSRSASPTMIAKYETELIDKKILRQKLHEFYELGQQTLQKQESNESE